MSGISPRADTLNTLMQVFKGQGVDVVMGADEVSITVSHKTALAHACKTRLECEVGGSVGRPILPNLLFYIVI